MMDFKKATLGQLLYCSRFTEYRKLALIEIHERLIDTEGDWK